MAHVYARPHHMLQTEEEVLDIVEDDPSTSTREIARQVALDTYPHKRKTFLGLPEIDFGLDLANTYLYRETDIFGDDTDLESSIKEEADKTICDEYDVIIDNQRIDCSKLRLVKRSLPIQHNLEKRQADEPLEGSGFGDELAEKPTSDAPQPDGLRLNAPGPEEVPPNEPNPSEPDEPPAVEKVDPVEVLAVAGEPTAPPPPNPDDKENPAEKNAEATEAPAVEEAKEGSEEKEPYKTDSEEAKQSTQPPAVDSTDVPDGNNSDKATESIVKKDAGAGESEAKEAEPINDQQSGVAIVDGASGGLEETDKAVQESASNAKTKSTSVGSEPNAGEVSGTQEARKDTKILIILFVAVVVVGGAAFTYNFVKKRKQKRARAVEQNGDGNGLKADQNQRSDPERGTELKPLMRNADGKSAVAEYNDERDGVKVEGGQVDRGEKRFGECNEILRRFFLFYLLL
ncbi:hypothetical protein NQ317_000388 [Molorchus minor]|uniref:Uncharacterized protein n=1 Tax=Molorchus minor TaxID=1323400 RepID=A0ABQ9JBA3_9CUCU|nr:hypothetical protein NQ317_000388 [Molorchus minor]